MNGNEEKTKNDLFKKLIKLHLEEYLENNGNSLYYHDIKNIISSDNIDNSLLSFVEKIKYDKLISSTDGLDIIFLLDNLSDVYIRMNINSEVLKKIISYFEERYESYIKYNFYLSLLTKNFLIIFYTNTILLRLIKYYFFTQKYFKLEDVVKDYFDTTLYLVSKSIEIDENMFSYISSKILSLESLFLELITNNIEFETKDKNGSEKLYNVIYNLSTYLYAEVNIIKSNNKQLYSYYNYMLELLIKLSIEMYLISLIKKGYTKEAHVVLKLFKSYVVDPYEDKEEGEGIYFLLLSNISQLDSNYNTIDKEIELYNSLKVKDFSKAESLIKEGAKINFNPVFFSQLDNFSVINSDGSITNGYDIVDIKSSKRISDDIPIISYAIKNKDSELINFLVKNKIDFNIPDFINVVNNEDLNEIVLPGLLLIKYNIKIDSFIDYIDLNFYDIRGGYNIVNYITSKNKIKLIEKLLKYDINMNSKIINFDESTESFFKFGKNLFFITNPLYFCIKNDDVNLFKLLVNKANIFINTFYMGFNAIHIAGYFKSKNIIKEMLSINKGLINIPSGDGKTILNFFEDDKEFFDYLKNNGAIDFKKVISKEKVKSKFSFKNILIPFVGKLNRLEYRIAFLLLMAIILAIDIFLIPYKTHIHNNDSFIYIDIVLLFIIGTYFLSIIYKRLIDIGINKKKVILGIILFFFLGGKIQETLNNKDIIPLILIGIIIILGLIPSNKFK